MLGRSINPDICLICFAIDNPTSFEQVTKRWIPTHKRLFPQRPFLIVGTKSDLRDQEATDRELVPSGEEQKLAKTYATQYIECSAKTGSGVHRLFNQVTSHSSESSNMLGSRRVPGSPSGVVRVLPM